MITEKEYLEAKKIIDEYKKQLRISNVAEGSKCNLKPKELNHHCRKSVPPSICVCGNLAVPQCWHSLCGTGITE